MPIPVPTKGYDPLFDYTPKEIESMYLAEGKDPAWAKAQAVAVSREIHRLNIQEQRLWDKVRDFEIPSEKITLLVDS